jgi:hypothetical protein
MIGTASSQDTLKNPFISGQKSKMTNNDFGNSLFVGKTFVNT